MGHNTRLMSPKPSSITQVIFGLILDPVKLTVDLFKVIIPIIIAVRILQQVGAVRSLALPLTPVMDVVGLPAEMGLVWATAMINNIYGGIAVLLSLTESTPLSTAQMTVLCSMMLVAHTLLIELKIAQLSGPRLPFQALCRLGSAMLLGWILYTVYRHGPYLQEPAAILIAGRGGHPPHEQTLAEWALDQTQNLVTIFIIILCLFLVMRLLEKVGVIELLNRLLRPLLLLLGIGPKASAVTVIGLTLGVTYGGGLIIHEARSGKLKKEDVFYSLTLMGLSHALIEDTLLMMMVGGHLSGVLWARIVFSLVLVAVIVRVSQWLPEAFADRFLWGKPGKK